MNIKSNFFKNMYNDDYIENSYNFLTGIKYYNSVDNKRKKKHNIVAKFDEDIIFMQIRNIYYNIVSIRSEVRNKNKKISIFKEESANNENIETMLDVSKKSKNTTKDSEFAKASLLLDEMLKQTKLNEIEKARIENEIERLEALYNQEKLIDFTIELEKDVLTYYY